MVDARYVWVNVSMLLGLCGVGVLQFAVSMGTRGGSLTFFTLIVHMRGRARCVCKSVRLACGYAVGGVIALCVSVIRVFRGPLMVYLY